MFAIKTPTTEAEMYDFVAKAAILPAALWFSKVDLKTTVDAFARDNRYAVYDVSPMFRNLGNDARKVDTAVTMLSTRSTKYTETIHFVAMDEYSVEAMIILDVLLQLRDLHAGITDAICVGKHLLHGICIFNGYTIKLHDVKDALVVRALLSQMERDGECVICLESLNELQTVIPFKCGHPMCSDCRKLMSAVACPKCRETQSWNSLPAFEINDFVRQAIADTGDAGLRCRVSRK